MKTRRGFLSLRRTRNSAMRMNQSTPAKTSQTSTSCLKWKFRQRLKKPGNTRKLRRNWWSAA